MMRGHNQDPAYEHSLDHHLEFFSKAGSLMKGRKPYPFYGSEPEVTALGLFQMMWIVNNQEARKTALQLLFWLRDPRGGAGNRSAFRECLSWLVGQPGGKEWVQANIDLIPEHGRFDDLKTLFGTGLESQAAELWVKKILDHNHYALKWAKRDMVPLQRVLKTNEAGLRKLLRVPERATVENIMCANMALCPKCRKMTHMVRLRNGNGDPTDNYMCGECRTLYPGSPVHWEGIQYAHVPSVAMKLYCDAFKAHDPVGYEKFMADLLAGKAKVNASVLFPHNCKQLVDKGQADLADAMFDALPDYIKDSGRKIMVLADTSGSMETAQCSPGVRPIDVAISLALYCSDRLGKDNPFYKTYMEFETTPLIVKWTRVRFHEAIYNHHGYCGSTNIQAALDMLLEMGITFGANKENMIDTILIISDMQFDRHTSNGEKAMYGSAVACEGTSNTAVENCMKAWDAAGFKRPNIVYWNVAGYAGQPATCQTPNTALVSGFSPSILKAVFEDAAIDSMSILRRAIAKYAVRTP